MATLRARFKVAWNDQPPVEIKTSARDMTNVSSEHQDNPAMATFALIYYALVRLGHDVGSLDDFIDTLDEAEQLDTAVDGVEGPTPLVATPGGLSPLPARPAAITEGSLAKTMTGHS